MLSNHKEEVEGKHSEESHWGFAEASSLPCLHLQDHCLSDTAFQEPAGGG